MIRTDNRVRLCACLLIVNLAIIWGNSLLPGSESSAMSGGVMAFLMKLLGIPGAYEELVHTLIRKLAHFTEFACFAMLLTWMCGMMGESGFHLKVLPVCGGMAAALVDESIQLITPDRGPSLVDVWIDTSGAVMGMMMLLIGYHLLKRNKHKNILEETT